MGKRKKKLCVFCVASPATEKEHVLPSSWYPTTTPPSVQRLTVPVCGACADAFEKDERSFKAPLLMGIDPDHPDAAGVQDGYRRSWQITEVTDPRDAQHRRDQLLAIKRRLRFVLPPDDGVVRPRVQARTENGLIVTAAPALEVDRGSASRLTAKLVRGLHFKEYGVPLPASARMGFFWGKDLDGEARAEFAKIPVVERLAPGLRYRFWVEGSDSVWLFLLWGQLEFGGLVKVEGSTEAVPVSSRESLVQ